jgi:hypothetical protein
MELTPRRTASSATRLLVGESVVSAFLTVVVVVAVVISVVPLLDEC